MVSVGPRSRLGRVRLPPSTITTLPFRQARRSAWRLAIARVLLPQDVPLVLLGSVLLGFV